MTQPTDDLAAQMVREMLDNDYGNSLRKKTSLEAIARRYMEKLFSEGELIRTINLSRCTVMTCSGILETIRAERAGKDGR